VPTAECDAALSLLSLSRDRPEAGQHGGGAAAGLCLRPAAITGPLPACLRCAVVPSAYGVT